MALPKRKQSKARGRKRRTHYKAAGVSTSECPPMQPAKNASSCLSELRLLPWATYLIDARIISPILLWKYIRCSRAAHV